MKTKRNTPKVTRRPQLTFWDKLFTPKFANVPRLRGWPRHLRFALITNYFIAPTWAKLHHVHLILTDKKTGVTEVVNKASWREKLRLVKQNRIGQITFPVILE